MFQFPLFSFQWWILKSFKDFFFVFLPSSKSTTTNTELVCNIFIRSIQVLLMFRTLLSISLHDVSFLWPFLSRQPPTIEFKQIQRFQNRILWHSNWNIRIYYSSILQDEKTNSETKIRITRKIQPGDPKICSI